MANALLKTLRTKTGVLKRLTHDKKLYESEVDEQRGRIQRDMDQGKDEHHIRKQEEGLLETLKMVPHCQELLAKAYEELLSLLVEGRALKDTEEYLAAQKMLEFAAPQLPATTDSQLATSL